MAKIWKEVGGFKQATPIKINDEIDQITEGVFDGYAEHVGENDSNVYYIVIDGETCSFWGGTVLDARLPNVEKGSEIRITYKGKAKSKTPGRKGFHDYKIEVADGEDEDETPTPKVTKSTKPTAPKKAQTDEEVEEGDLPF